MENCYFNFLITLVYFYLILFIQIIVFQLIFHSQSLYWQSRIRIALNCVDGGMWACFPIISSIESRIDFKDSSWTTQSPASVFTDISSQFWGKNRMTNFLMFKIVLPDWSSIISFKKVYCGWYFGKNIYLFMFLWLPEQKMNILSCIENEYQIADNRSD
jgi:hypothetical protein